MWPRQEKKRKFAKFAWLYHVIATRLIIQIVCAATHYKFVFVFINAGKAKTVRNFMKDPRGTSLSYMAMLEKSPWERSARG